ncbi:MAG: hypothetical protein NZT92_00030 [Abditibacteriales bacterium]|nr:hypothetical protein [Abditibacteriales bacterium]MDW8364897.1 hypothetical protein [Abditibacteriales bacterium]
MTNPQTIRIAGIVLKWVRADKEANYRLVPLMREAAANGAQMVCSLPLWTCAQIVILPPYRYNPG